MNITQEVKKLITLEAKKLLKEQPEDFQTLKEAELSVYESLIDDLDDAGYYEF